MRPGARRLLVGMLCVGVAARVALAFATQGQMFDIGNLRLAGDAFADDPLSVYGAVDVDGAAGPFELDRWPYPPAYLPVAALASWVADVSGLPFHGVVSVAPIAADVAIAWLVQDLLGREGHGERVRLAAAALVALGPSFIIVSGYHGQIDAVAILPALAALWVWHVAPPRTRAVRAGGLIGLAVCIKTFPAVLLVALVPAARSRREGFVLVASAAAVVLVVVAPYLIAEPAPFLEALRYAGAPGLGGLSMFLQPALTDGYLTGAPGGGPSALIDVVSRHAHVLVAAGLAVTAAFLLRHRAPAVQAAALVWLALYLVNPVFFPQYAIWGLPFLLVAGRLREVAALQAALLPAAVLTYGAPWELDGVLFAYLALMTAVWLGWASLLVRTGRSIMRPSQPRRSPGVTG